MRVLDLFSGTGSIIKGLSDDDEGVSVDFSGEFHEPTIKIDIMEWDYKSAYPPNHFDAVFAGVPCTEYSRLRDCCKKPNHLILKKLTKSCYERLRSLTTLNQSFGSLRIPTAESSRNNLLCETYRTTE